LNKLNFKIIPSQENKPTKQKIVEDDDDMDEMMSELCAEAEATKKSPATTIKKSPDAAAKKSPAKKPAPASTSAPAAKKVKYFHCHLF
jgi:hypothetical protein